MISITGNIKRKDIKKKEEVKVISKTKKTRNEFDVKSFWRYLEWRVLTEIAINFWRKK